MPSKINQKTEQSKNNDLKSKKQQTSLTERITYFSTIIPRSFGILFEKLAAFLNNSSYLTLSSITVLISLAIFVADEIYFNFYSPDEIKISILEAQKVDYTFSSNRNIKGYHLVESFIKRLAMFSLSFILPQLVIFLIVTFNSKIKPVIATIFNASNDLGILSGVLTYIITVRFFTGFIFCFEGSNLWSLLTTLGIFVAIIVTIYRGRISDINMPLWKIFIRAIVFTFGIQIINAGLVLLFGFITGIKPLSFIFSEQNLNTEKIFKKFFNDENKVITNIFILITPTALKLIKAFGLILKKYTFLVVSADLLMLHSAFALNGAFKYQLNEYESLDFPIMLLVSLSIVFLILIYLNRYFYNNIRNYTLETILKTISKILSVLTIGFFILNLVSQVLEYKNDMKISKNMEYCCGYCSFIVRNTVDIINRNAKDFRTARVTSSCFSLFNDHSSIYNRILRFSRIYPNAINVSSSRY